MSGEAAARCSGISKTDPNLSTITTDCGLNIHVYAGDITKAKADAIAVEEQTSWTDAPGQIVKLLENDLQKDFRRSRQSLFSENTTLIEGEIYETEVKSRDIDYHFVFHVVMPRNKDSNLEELYYKICSQADKMGITNIAIQLLGTDLVQGDVNHVIHAVCRGLMMLAEKKKKQMMKTLKEVQIVVFEHKIKSKIVETVLNSFEQKSELSESDRTEVNSGELMESKLPAVNSGELMESKLPAVNSGELMESKLPAVNSEELMESKLPDMTTGQKTKNLSETSKLTSDDCQDMKKETISEKDEVDICVICQERISDPRTLEKCKHVFCRECIEASFKLFKPVCPQCHTAYGVITGNMPNGRMSDYTSPPPGLPGYEKYGIITINYDFPSGIQTKEHPNPGVKFQGTSRTAYLPNNDQGRKVLKLLKVAWSRRLIFTVGRSATTGRDNVVTWNDIHHKTSYSGGEIGFGYPDDLYLSRVMEELSIKGVTEEDI